MYRYTHTHFRSGFFYNSIYRLRTHFIQTHTHTHMPAANMSPEVSLSPRKRESGPKNTEHSHACMPAHFHIPKDLHVSVCCFGTAHKVIHHLELWLPPRTIVMPLPPTLNPETQCYPFIYLLAHAALSGVIAAEELRVGIEKAR